MALRAIVAFRLDEESRWVAQLACGHCQHLHHDPPWQERAWVTSEAGRKEKLGQLLPCRFCEMPTLPAGARVYKSTAEFDEKTVPKGLLANHQTKAGTWGRIVVREGRLLYTLASDSQSWSLSPGTAGIIAPSSLHKVEPQGPVRFLVEFLRVEPETGE